MGLPRRVVGNGRPSKGDRRLISTRVSDVMASDMVVMAAELGLSITDQATLLLSREMNHPIPQWIAGKLDQHDNSLELPLEQEVRRRRQVGPTRLVLVTAQEVAGDGRRLGVRIPDDLADDIIRMADDMGLCIGDCTAMLLARQLNRPIPPWVQERLKLAEPQDKQLALGA